MTRFNSRLAAVAAVVVLAPAVSGCGINAIPSNEEKAKEEWGNVQAAYQRRADLVPNLVATVEAAAIAERTTLTDVIEARSRATSVQLTPEMLEDPQAVARFQAAQGELTQALSRLLVVAEQYPTVRSNDNFVALQSQLEGTENRINIARRDYNAAARVHNTALRTFPTVIWASTIHSGSKPLPLFSATEAAQNAPQVSFNVGGAPAAPSAAPGSAPPAQ